MPVILYSEDLLDFLYIIYENKQWRPKQQRTFN